MEDNIDNINNIFDICKEYHKNENKLKEKKIDELFQKMDKDDYNDNKKVKKLSYEKIYIVDKQPIEDIMNKLNFSEYESLLNEQEDDKIKEKIKELIKNNPSLNIKDDLKKIKFYSTFDEVSDIFNNNKKIYFLKEEYLNALGIHKKKVKDKFIYFSKLRDVILFKFNEGLDSLMIKIPDKIKNENKDDDNINSNNHNNINNNIINNEDDEDDENDELKHNIDRNIEIVSHHSDFLNSINELKSVEVQDLNNITQIKNTLFDSNEDELAIDCFLVECEIFNKFEEEIYYDECQLISLITEEEEEDKKEKIEELMNKMKSENKEGKYNNDIKIINDYEDCCNLINNNNDIEFTFVNKQFCDDANMDKKLYEKSNLSLFMANDELFLFFKDKQKIMKVFRTNKYFKLNISIENLINVPENIVEDLVSLYIEENKIDKLIAGDMKNNKFENYFLINKEWLNQYKNYYNFQEIVLKYEEQNSEDEEEDKKEVLNHNNNYNSNYNNYNKRNNNNYNYKHKNYNSFKNYNNNNYNYYYDNNNNQYFNRNRKNNYYKHYNYKNKNNKKWDKNNKMNYNNNNYNNNYNNNNLSAIKNDELKNSDNNKSNLNKKKEKYNIKVQYENKKYPKLLLEEKNLIPEKFNYKTVTYYKEFELIRIETLKALCSHLNINIQNIKSDLLDQISFRVLLGNDQLIMQRKLKKRAFYIFSSRGIFNILNYLLIFENKNLAENEINNIKEKGIEKYLVDMSIDLYTKDLQYLTDLTNYTIIGNVYVVKRIEDNTHEFNNSISINNNINNSNINNDNNNDNIENNNNENSNFEIQQNRPYRLGLNNIGATCYMNASLQCLCNIPQLQNYFLYNNKIFKGSQYKLSRSFGDLMRNLYTKEDKKSFSPDKFKELIGNMNPLFKGINANDSKDLILFLYEKIHEELNELNNYNKTEQNIPNDLLQFRKNYYSLNSSIIEKTFYFEQITIYQCENCKNKTTNYGIQNLLIFPLEKTRINLARKYPNGYICVNLEDCFKELCQPEYMQGENKMYCNSCGIQTDAKYFTELNNCPEVMTIVLNRGKGNEYDVEFDFPLNINIKSYVHLQNQCTEYDLISVLVHTGTSDMSGHFFAFCKSNVDRKWYLYNDSIVSECSSDFNNQIKNTGLPYVLFYQRTDFLNSQNNNNSNDIIVLYFKTYDGKEVYLDANKNELFSNVIMRLAQKYNNVNWNASYYLGTAEGELLIDINKTVLRNYLCNYSNITVVN